MIDDDRGRVPFAVVGILLLIGSATVATTMAPTAPPDEPAVDVVVDRVEAEGQTALRRSVRSAAVAGASDPVVQPANTTVGRALGNESTFRASLRLRVYVAARERLSAIERRRGDVVATTGVAPIDATDTRSVRRAIERVDLSAADPNATAVTVELGNVTTTVRRGERVVHRETTDHRVTVATPVLALHDRVRAYETQLDAPVTEPGLEQRLAVILNAAGWARGYAQYSGAPIDNVVSNTHVELATNAALLDVQRSTIGRADPAAVDGMGVAVATAAAQETLAMKPGPSPFLQQALDSHSVVQANDIEGLDVPSRDEPMTVGVNRTADEVFLAMMTGPERSLATEYLLGDDVTIGDVVEATYSAEVRLSTVVRNRSGGVPDVSAAPGAGWRRIGSTVTEDVTVTPAGTNGPTNTTTSASGEWHVLDRFSRRVVVDYERRTRWARGGERTLTTATGTESASVTVSVEGRHAPDAAGPHGLIRGVHERGSGPLNGSNLAGVESAAVEKLIDAEGGRDAVARAALENPGTSPAVRVTGEVPPGLRDWIYRDLVPLREEVANVTVEVDRQGVGTFAVNPPKRLADRIADRRASLLAAAPPYDGVADRARVAARARYLSFVVSALDARARHRRMQRGELDDALDEHDAGSVAALQRSTNASAEGPAPRRPALRGPGGPVRIRVDAAPGYLTLSNVTESTVPAVDGETTPLAARNVNLFSLPYGDVINGLIEAFLSGPDRTSLGTAGRTLRSSTAVGSPGDPAGGDRARYLEGTIRGKLTIVRETTVDAMADLDVGRDDEQRRTIVEAGLARWNDTASRAIAVSNGSAAPAIVAAADARTDLSVVERDRLGLEIDRTIRSTLSSSAGQPRTDAVSPVYEAAKSEVAGAARDLAEEYAEKSITTLTNGTVTSIPKGMPLAPFPGYWFATTNVWTVDVAGEYARFGVRASRGRPTDPGADLVYARDGSMVTLDVDGDGNRERLGRASRVDFSATAHVVVVVPPGMQGVGDVSGERTEESAGWPPAGE